MGGENFNRDSSIEANIPGAIHFAHPPCAQWRLDLIRAEFYARGQRHSWRNYSPAHPVADLPTNTKAAFPAAFALSDPSTSSDASGT